MSGLLSDLLKSPLGNLERPFKDSDILSEQCKSVPTNTLSLRDISLFYGDHPTGLTQCEPTQPEYRKRDHDVKIKGVLVVETLGWLSPDGLERVQEALRIKDTEQRALRAGRNLPSSTVTLASLFGNKGVMSGKRREDLKLKIWIQAERNMPTTYFLPHGQYQGAILYTKDKNRVFRIFSMHPRCFELSHLFLQRYRHLNLLRELVTIDKAHNGTDEEAPQYLRTPHWFVNQFIRHKVLTPDDDSDEESGDVDEATQLFEMGTLPRVRHISRAEVYSIIGKHAEWLVKEQRGVRFHHSRVFDVDIWAQWIRDGKKAAKVVRRHINVRPREPVEDNEEDRVIDFALPGRADEEERMDVESDNYSDEFPEPPAPPVIKLRSQRNAEKDLNKARGASSRRSVKRLRTGSPAASENSRSPPPPQPYGSEFDSDDGGQEPTHELYEYDSDFTDPALSSSPAPSDSSDYPSRPPSPSTASLLTRVPAIMQYAPKLPTSFVWVCPVKGCNLDNGVVYEIDLRNLQECHWKDVIPDEMAERIMEGQWLLTDDWLQNCFNQMVSKHYYEHLEKLGLRIEGQGKETRLKALETTHNHQLVDRVKDETMG